MQFSDTQKPHPFVLKLERSYTYYDEHIVLIVHILKACILRKIGFHLAPFGIKEPKAIQVFFLKKGFSLISVINTFISFKKSISHSGQIRFRSLTVRIVQFHFTMSKGFWHLHC